MDDDDEFEVIEFHTTTPFEVLDAAIDLEWAKLVSGLDDDQMIVVFTLMRSVDALNHVGMQLAQLQARHDDGTEAPEDEYRPLQALNMAYVLSSVIQRAHAWYDQSGQPDLVAGVGGMMSYFPQLGDDDPRKDHPHE